LAICGAVTVTSILYHLTVVLIHKTKHKGNGEIPPVAYRHPTTAKMSVENGPGHLEASSLVAL
jgi:hypothetical protein